MLGRDLPTPAFGPLAMRYVMNGRFQMQGGKNRIFPKRLMQTGSSGSLIGWKSGQTFCPSLGPNGGSVAMDSDHLHYK